MRHVFVGLCLAGCALPLLGGAALAAQRLPPGLPEAAALLLRYDANHDGVITRDEMEAGLKADFAEADTNHDNCLDPEEVREENDRRIARDGAAASPIKDWNLDGCVDMREFANMAHSYFSLVDRRRDGRVTVLELRGPTMPIAPPAKPQSAAAAETAKAPAPPPPN